MHAQILLFEILLINILYFVLVLLIYSVHEIIINFLFSWNPSFQRRYYHHRFPNYYAVADTPLSPFLYQNIINKFIYILILDDLYCSRNQDN